MKKVGKQVAFMQAGEGRPRVGEGSFVHLKDGSILYVFTQYYGNRGGDHDTARIVGCYSYDDGETFGEPVVLIEKDDEALNLMSASVLRLQNGDIGLVYLRKTASGQDRVVCMPYFCRSTDECKTFSEPVCCVGELGYLGVINDGLIQLKNGRVMFAFTDAGESIGLQATATDKVRFAYSDDNGETWQHSKTVLISPYNDTSGFNEPTVLELPDGRLWVYIRTGYGHQWQSYSSDNGETWTTPAPNLYFTSPNSPMKARTVGEYTVAIFNPIPYNCLNDRVEDFKAPKRTPFVCAVSRDGGCSFDTTDKCCANGALLGFNKCCVLLEDDLTNSYCYPAIIDTKDGFLVAYYHSNNTKYCLNSTKIIKVTFAELEASLAENE